MIQPVYSVRRRSCGRCAVPSGQAIMKIQLISTCCLERAPAQPRI
jgi:hypothetical protein